MRRKTAGKGFVNVRLERSARGGFTLVELLVVIAVIAILIGVLLPSLAGARQVAQSMVALSNNRQLVIAQQGYSASADGWLPGPNTSGALAWAGTQSGVAPGEYLVGSKGSDTPTQTFDWISPSLGTELGLSSTRAERMYQIWERFRCPRATRFVDELYAEGGAPADVQDFSRVAATTPYRQNSYLAPGSFHFSPYENGAPVWVPSRMKSSNVWTQKSPFNNPCTLPSTYRPRTDLLARPDSKVAVGDGTRYVSAQGGIGGATVILDFDISANASTYGGFTTSGPIFDKSVAYGRNTYPAAAGQINVQLSMRYFDGEMHVGYFDGHADRITANEAYSTVEWWYPRGSTFTGTNATAESKKAYNAGDEIP